MSYGIGIVIPKEDLSKDKIRYDFCDWTLPITNKICPKDCKKAFIKWHKEFKDELKQTSIDLLRTAPCDCVCVIDSDGNFENLNRSNYKLSSEADINKYFKK